MVHFFRSLAAGALTLGLSLAPAVAQTAKPAIVLVHGAWADASSWTPVVTKLQAAGYTVYTPPNNLRGPAADAAVISRFLRTIPGPVVLVGHSYGGFVISVASAGASNVKGLVFVDAFAPDTGESVQSILSAAPPPPKDALIPVPFDSSATSDADLYFNPKYFGAVFASAESPSVAAVMAAEQRPIAASALTEKAPAAEGWRTIPSWYVLGDADKTIAPSIQLSMATRAKSTIVHVPGGDHPSMIAHPDETVSAILAAAKAAQ